MIRLDPARPEPLYDQLASALRGALAKGEVRAGERLPGARELAESLGVNIHTVLRGYQQLRDEGLLDLRRGRGAVVTQAAGASGATVQDHARLRAAIATAQTEARRLGLSARELTELIREGY